MSNDSSESGIGYIRKRIIAMTKKSLWYTLQSSYRKTKQKMKRFYCKYVKSITRIWHHRKSWLYEIILELIWYKRSDGNQVSSLTHWRRDTKKFPTWSSYMKFTYKIHLKKLIHEIFMWSSRKLRFTWLSREIVFVKFA